MKKENEETGSARRRLQRVKPERVATVADLHPSNTKIKVAIYLDLDVLNCFKMRAAQPNADCYQMQIANELRAIMERE